MNNVNPPGEMVCDQCDRSWPCHLREFHMGTRVCECGGRYVWFPADRPGDGDDWEAW